MEGRGSARRARAVRAASALFALGVVAFAFREGDWTLSEHGIGWTQAALLLAGLALGACCFAPLEWNAKVLVLAASIALTLLAAELGLRLIFSPRYYPPFQLDARLLYTLVPEARREHRRAAINGGDHVLYRINSAGFRGEELAPGQPAARILVYGDSFIQAEYSELQHTFAERLERRVSERLGKEVEVVNAGVAGYGPDQILRRMQDELARLRPDLVLVALYAGNDFGDLVRNKLYRLNEDGSLRENSFTISPWLTRKLETSRRESILEKIAREAARALRGDDPWTLDESASARFSRMDSFLEQSRAEYREYVLEGDDEVRELLVDPYNADVSLTPDADSVHYKIELMDGLVAAMEDLSDELRIPLALVLIPHPIDVDGHESAAVDRARYPDYEPSGMTDILARIAERRRIPYLNLFAPFRERGGRALYFRGADDHWNDLGQDVAAASVAEFVLSNGLLFGTEHRAP
jgi:hypothetical protein